MSRAVLLILVFFVASAQAQDTNEKTATCFFEDGRAVSLRYVPAPSSHDIPQDKAWAPSGKPMVLFTDVPLTVGSSELATGAYRAYLLRNQDSWNLILNKNVDPSAKYDASQDVARVPLQTGALPTPQPQTKMVFGKMGGKQCNLRVYHSKLGIFGAEFREK